MNIEDSFQKDVALAPYTTYKIGGPADYLMVARSRDELVESLNYARVQKMPYLILGMGANVLIGDRGFRGLVVINQCNEVSLDGNTLIAGSGAIISDLIEQCQEHGLSGLEHFAGIPSTVGGAIWQNLHFLSPDHTYTVYIADVTVSAEIMDKEGVVRTIPKEGLAFGYDQSILREDPTLTCLGATFSLKPEDPKVISERIEANKVWRRERHPDFIEYPSCGSVFKKIEGVGAGRLIEDVGLKGHMIGGAQISTKHSNFIVNTGGATAADVLNLIELVQQEVLRKTGYKLEPEIRMIGEL